MRIRKYNSKEQLEKQTEEEKEILEIENSEKEDEKEKVLSKFVKY